jgi:hypothetical protein
MNHNLLSYLSKRIVWFALIAGILLIPQQSSARFRYHGNGWGGSHYWWGHDGLYRWGFHGRWYGYRLFVPPIGAFIAELPFGCSTIVIGENPYYCYNGYYLRPYLSGYVVVEEPVVAAATSEPAVQPAAPAKKAQPADSSGAVQTKPGSKSPAGSTPTASTPASSSSDETITINVPNSHGTFTPVVLTKHGNGYLGPQGEMYIGNPTVAQLKALYGK